MALRALMLRKELDQLNKQLAELRTKAEGFTAREAELETAINEAETDEERNTVSEAVEAFENEREEVTGEIAGLEERVSGIESELEALEENQDPAPAPAADPEPKPENRERGFIIMNNHSFLTLFLLQELTPKRLFFFLSGLLCGISTLVTCLADSMSYCLSF